jgi:hypothetical protein
MGLKKKHTMKSAWILVAGGVLFTGGYLYKLYRDAERMEINIGSRIHAINPTGMQVGVSVELKNPSGSSFSIRQPFVKLAYQGRTLGSSTPNRDWIEIAAGKETKFGVIIDLPWTSLVFLGIQVVQKIKQGKFELTLEAITETMAKVAVLDVPLQWSEPIVLKR